MGFLNIKKRLRIMFFIEITIFTLLIIRIGWIQLIKGTEYKNLMYETYKNIIYLNKSEEKKKLYYLNIIDCNLNIQRTLVRIMYKYRWIDEKKFDIIMKQHLYEIGSILGGLIKYYAKNNEK